MTALATDVQHQFSHPISAAPPLVEQRKNMEMYKMHPVQYMTCRRGGATADRADTIARHYNNK